MSEAALPPPMADAPFAAPVPPPVPKQLDDFNDRLSPMLVKELRQGLRARTFVAVFLALQILLALVLLLATAARNQAQAGTVISSIIFFFFSMAVLVVQPLRGIGVLHSEIKSNTIELMVLTRLNAWRIVLGKWVSIVSQSALLLVAIAPYLILRYFFGGMNLAAELVLLGLIFATSAAATAVTVGISALPSILLRGLAPLAGVMFLLFFLVSVVSQGFRSVLIVGTLDTPETRWGVFIYLLGLSYVSWTTLGLGASMIAPASENHSTIRRLIALALLLITAVIAGSSASVRPEVVMSMILLIGIPAAFTALSENGVILPPVSKSFERFGPIGRFGGIFLYPGWQSGTFFTLLFCLSAVPVVHGLWPSPKDDDLIRWLICVVSSLIFPAIISTWLRHRFSNRLSSYMTILLSSILVTIVLVILAETMDRGVPGESGFLWFFCWLPPVLGPLGEVYWSSSGSATTASIFIGVAYASLAAVQALFRWKDTRGTGWTLPEKTP